MRRAQVRTALHRSSYERWVVAARSRASRLRAARTSSALRDELERGEQRPGDDGRGEDHRADERALRREGLGDVALEGEGGAGGGRVGAEALVFLGQRVRAGEGGVAGVTEGLSHGGAPRRFDARGGAHICGG